MFKIVVKIQATKTNFLTCFVSVTTYTYDTYMVNILPDSQKKTQKTLDDINASLLWSNEKSHI